MSISQSEVDRVSTRTDLSAADRSDAAEPGRPAAAESVVSPVHPPPANRGGETTEPEQSGVSEGSPVGVSLGSGVSVGGSLGSGVSGRLGRLFGVGFDFLTVTVGPESRDFLLGQSQFVEAGYGQRGFGRSEERAVMGGKAWRKMDPHAESKVFGLEYESWEFSGGTASWPARQLVGRVDVRPSRIDLAFDFECDDSLRPDDLLAEWRPHFLHRGYKPGISGEGDVNTCYIGSRNSERRIRIYRKDLQKDAIAALLGPVMRVELVLKDRQACSLWAVHDNDGAAERAAAAHVLHITGFRAMDDAGDIPPLVDLDMVADPAQGVMEFVKRDAGTLCAFVDAGIDIEALCREHLERSGRTVQWRSERRADSIRLAGRAQVERLVRVMLAFGAGGVG